MIIVDANIWIDHFRGEVNPVLDELVLVHEAAMHPHVLGEIALGSFRNRDALLSRLTRLPVPNVARPGHLLYMIDEQRLWSKGIGYTDAHLLASALVTPDGEVWTRDRRLRAQAERLNVAFKP